MLTSKGFFINTTNLTPHDIEKITDDLTVKPESYVGTLDTYKLYAMGKEYVYLPRHYAINTFIKEQHIKYVDRSKITFGDKINCKMIEPFKSLTNEQQKTFPFIIKAFQQYSSAILKLPCGHGKTVLSIYLAHKISRKTLIVVHTLNLLDQWAEEIKKYTNATVGFIHGNRFDIDCDFIMTTIHNVIGHGREPKWRQAYSKIGLTIIDECFPHNQKVLTSNGPINIGKLYYMWKNNDKLPLVKSFNIDKNIFEYKKITYAWKKKRDDLLEIKYFKSNMKCTPEHKIFTPNGWIKAKDLKVGDLLIANYDKNIQNDEIAKQLNDDQEQILIGSFLGDGSLQKLKSGRYRLKIKHSIKQRKYCNWKAWMFGITKIEQNDYTDKELTFNTKIIDIQHNIPNIKTFVPQWMIDKLDYRAIAIWIMDNGYIHPDNNTTTINSHSFDEDSHDRLIKKLNDIDIPCYKKIIRKDNKQYFNIYITNIGTYKIYPYIHGSNLNSDCIAYKWNNSFKEYGTYKIISIKSIKNPQIIEKGVYDIEVEDNHTFVICENNSDNGVVVSNCHHTSASEFCKALKILNTWYMLGLTATPHKGERMKINHVFKQFLGPIVPPENVIDFSEKQNEVQVHIIKYSVPADNPELDQQLMIEFAGKPNTAQMISNISINDKRNNFLIKLIEELINMNENNKESRQILLVSDRICMLKYIYTFLQLKNIDSGLFIGGMKTSDREKTKQKQVILGTYGVCEEGLNVRSLNTLIIGTPRRECEQMIGRVLRKEHKIPVIIVDIWDMFSKTFINQGKSRQRFYKKKNYDINIDIESELN